jgi:hypothetical protein
MCGTPVQRGRVDSSFMGLTTETKRARREFLVPSVISLPPWLMVGLTRMVAGSPAVLRVVALLLVAPIGAAVIIAALLLFGVDPHLVFLPGFFVKARLEALGFHAPNAVGVLTTVAVWWAIIVLVWLTLRRVLRRSA